MASVYEIVTEKIMAELEKGIIPWQKPWTTEAPRNLSSGKAYRGINLFLLAASGYSSPYWLTYRQGIERGGNVRKGEHGTLIVFWKFDSNVTRKENEETDDETPRRGRAPILRYYTVFNVEQCEGIAAPAAGPAVPSFDAAEAIVAKYPAAPRMEKSDKAAYSPASDVVMMPARDSFHSTALYYSTLFHELTHSTGHESRLNREIKNVFGDHLYSKEELVAEMGAAMLCAVCGLENTHTVENTGAYLRSWLKALKGDSRMVVLAAAQAQKAADWIQGKTAGAEDSTPAPVTTVSYVPDAIAAYGIPAAIVELDATNENVPYCGVIAGDGTSETADFAGEL